MRWALLAALLQMAATCGQKGPLTLPEEETGRAPAIRLEALAGGPFPIGAAANAGERPFQAGLGGDGRRAGMAGKRHCLRAGLRDLAAA